MNQIKLTVSILTYNRSDVLKKLLISLSTLVSTEVEIIVVDNHSTDGTQTMMREEFPHINCIRTDQNLGATARNLGMKLAGGDIIVTLDDDIIGLNDKDILYLHRLFSENVKLGAVNFRITDHDQGNTCNWVHHRDEEAWSLKEFLTYEITEGAVAFRKAAVNDAGYYPDDFFISHEGPDLALRLLNYGYSIIYTPFITVVHHHSEKGRKKWLNYYYDTRNLIWLAVRNYPLSYGIRVLIRGLISMGFYSIRDGYLRYWLKAIWDGMIGIKHSMRKRKVINNDVLSLIKRIDKERPPLLYYIKKRLLKQGARL